LQEVAGFGATNSPAWSAFAGFGGVLQIVPVKRLPGQTRAKTKKHVKTQKNTNIFLKVAMCLISPVHQKKPGASAPGND
jgi:hypothetical protein